MFDTVPAEIAISSFSLVGILTGYIWNDQNKRISKIEDTQKSRPCNVIHLRIEKIATDVDWIKKNINR